MDYTTQVKKTYAQLKKQENFNQLCELAYRLHAGGLTFPQVAQNLTFKELAGCELSISTVDKLSETFKPALISRDISKRDEEIIRLRSIGYPYKEIANHPNVLALNLNKPMNPEVCANIVYYSRKAKK